MTAEEQLASNAKAFEALVRLAAETPDGANLIQPIPHWLRLLPISSPVGGLWYFSGDCTTCGKSSPLFFDYSEGDLGKPFKANGIVSFCCFCEQEIKIASEELHSVRWPLKPGEVVPESEYQYSKKIPKVHVDDPETHPISGALHHYTSIQVLESILRSKSLWVTHVRYLNDDSEGVLGLKHMNAVAEAALETATDIDKEFIQYFLKFLDGHKFEKTGVYVLSFSEAHNQLSQWRGYTPYGNGVCISIDSGWLVRQMQAQGWTFQLARYNLQGQLTWAESILNRMRRQAGLGHAKAGKAARFDEVLNNSMSDLLQVAATVKDSGFHEERELRFISPMIDIADARIHYRAKGDLQVPYVHFDLADAAGNLPIHEIMVGPGPKQGEAMATIDQWKVKYDIKGPCTITRCKTPYIER